MTEETDKRKRLPSDEEKMNRMFEKIRSDVRFATSIMDLSYFAPLPIDFVNKFKLKVQQHERLYQPDSQHR